MKKLLIISTLLLCVTTGAIAQETRLSSAPRSFRTFFASFKRAVERSDKAGVAAMTSFPFEYGFDAGDEGTMTKPQFIRRFSDIFSAAPRDFFTERDPLFSYGKGGRCVISTDDAAHLVFIKVGQTYKFLTYVVEP